ncbi:MAG: glycosyltransferase family 2 protein [Mucilaginibacter sp.]|nr:glycosyltransferase family 2 protein [Mucilaginibacter sp.]
MGKRLETVFAQTFQDFEVIILDDCSTDDSRTVIEQYKHHPKVSHIIYNESNSGSAFKQWQKGISLAKGKYIWIAESDDYSEPLFLEKMIGVFAVSPANTGLVYCKSLPVDEHNFNYDDSDRWMKRVDPDKWERDFSNIGKKEVEDYLSVQCTIPNASAVLFDARCFNEINWGDLDFKVCGDWYVYVTILKRYDLAYTSLPLNYHRNHHLNARSQNTGSSLFEQYKVLAYISKNFKITQNAIHNKAFGERLSQVLSMVKQGRISKSKFLGIIKLMRRFDKNYLQRLLRVWYGKVRRIDFNF